MRKRLCLLALTLGLAACGDSRLTPAPGQAPDWPSPGVPRPSYAPLPFTTNYAPVSGQIQDSPPARPDGSIPYAVRGQGSAPQSAPAPELPPPPQ